jgi:hypothetical protein
MIIESVMTPSECKAERDKIARREAFIDKYSKKYPDFYDDLMYAETGDRSQ